MCAYSPCIGEEWEIIPSEAGKMWPVGYPFLFESRYGRVLIPPDLVTDRHSYVQNHLERNRILPVSISSTIHDFGCEFGIMANGVEIDREQWDLIYFDLCSGSSNRWLRWKANMRYWGVSMYTRWLERKHGDSKLTKPVPPRMRKWFGTTDVAFQLQSELPVFGIVEGRTCRID